MLKILIAAIAAFIFSTSVGLYEWHSSTVKIEALKKDKEILQGQITGLEDLRKEDQKAVTASNKKVARVIKERSQLNATIERLSREKNNADFLAIPVPPELRDAAKSYLDARTKAPEN